MKFLHLYSYNDFMSICCNELMLALLMDMKELVFNVGISSEDMSFLLFGMVHVSEFNCSIFCIDYNEAKHEFPFAEYITPYLCTMLANLTLHHYEKF